MKIRTLTIVLLAAAIASVSVDGQSKLTPYSLSVMKQAAEQAETTRAAENKTVGAIINISNTSAVDSLRQLGIEISVENEDFVTARIPMEKIDAVSKIGGVKRVSFGRRPRLLTDITRSASHTNLNNVHNGVGFSQPYTGKGVIYGTVDSGIDFNHPAFKDSVGNTRMLYAADLTKNKYYTASQVSSLTTDSEDESHGSHTLGIGAGSNIGLPYYGMAPEAGIIACGGLDSDDRILEAIDYMVKRADELSMPIVINLSLGENSYGHDGSDAATAAINKYASAGHIVVVAAGNEADIDSHLGRTFEGNDTLRTFFYNGSSYTSLSQTDYNTPYAFDAYSSTANPFKVKIVEYDTSTKKIVYESEEFVATSLGDDTYQKTFSVPAQRGTGTVTLYARIDNGKYNVYGNISCKLSSTRRLGMWIYADKGTTINVWSDCYGLEFGDAGVSGYEAGNSISSINTWACGPNTISVGAYTSRAVYSSANGNSYNTRMTVNDITYFSSYGPDGNGLSRPEVIAPGSMLISAFSNYDSYYTDKKSEYYSDVVLTGTSTNSNRTYIYGVMQGTSMSAPVVAGIIATWLQACPTLSPQDIKDIFEKTAIKDSYYNADKFGAGKIDAQAGLLEVLKSSSVPGALRDEPRKMVLTPNPNGGEFSFVVPDAAGDIVLDVYSMTGAKVYSNRYDAAMSEPVSVNLRGELSAGMYVVRIIASNTVYTSKMVISNNL